MEDRRQTPIEQARGICAGHPGIVESLRKIEDAQLEMIEALKGDSLEKTGGICGQLSDSNAHLERIEVHLVESDRRFGERKVEEDRLFREHEKAMTDHKTDHANAKTATRTTALAFICVVVAIVSASIPWCFKVWEHVSK
jgi:hypothetical protein